MIYYEIKFANPGAHLLQVTVVVEKPDEQGQQLSLPAWIPGSYMIRDYARHVVSIRAESDGNELGIEKLNKSTWVCDPCDGPLAVTAEIYAWDQSVRGAHFDTTHAYFNGPCVFLRVHGQENIPCTLDIVEPVSPLGQEWRVATSMTRESAEQYGFGRYRCSDYAELIDHPVEVGELTIGEFEVDGIPHAIAIRGHYKVDMGRLCRDLESLCRAHMRLLGPPEDLDRYLFLLAVLDDGYGGLEHCWSSSLVCARRDLPVHGEGSVGEGYRRLLGLCSHEYFHLWNVKRLKPARFTPYDLSAESHTGLLWVFEGITSYYDDLVLCRSGLISQKSFLELLGQTITRVIRGPGRMLQSVEESSFDAWTKFYKQEANAGNAIVSYYAKGSLIALALDLKLRDEADRSLDDVMRECWSRYHLSPGGMPERGLESIAAELCGFSLEEFFERYVRGTDDPPLAKLLNAFGIQYHLRAAHGAKDRGGHGKAQGDSIVAWTGMTLVHRNGNSVVASVRAGSPAEQAGVSTGDLTVAIDSLRLEAGNLRRRLRSYRPGDVVTIAVFRRDELMRFKLTLASAPHDTCYLIADENVESQIVAKRNDWLGDQA